MQWKPVAPNSLGFGTLRRGTCSDVRRRPGERGVKLVCGTGEADIGRRATTGESIKVMSAQQ